MRALPHTLRKAAAPVGTQVRVRIDGPAGGTWTVTATGSRWPLAEPDGGRPAAACHLDAETAWRRCTRGIQPATALTRARIDGGHDLAEAVCQIASIVYWPQPQYAGPAVAAGARRPRSHSRIAATSTLPGNT
ncbi:hypothetical protein ACH4SK_41005 [Streptomyces inhibens]|uniref:hypothetical protein n=1 Tax=Streptomyces inhibens TaxID=2293571 RepID=UPI0037BC65FB